MEHFEKQQSSKSATVQDSSFRSSISDCLSAEEQKSTKQVYLLPLANSEAYRSFRISRFLPSEAFAHVHHTYKKHEKYTERSLIFSARWFVAVAF